ncbi:hypothetical protein B5807_08680 [Epicoccum nigrum]|uniref:Uncharacterized protein n=1 Tax=Epicoccum nigrum TaxID=105696 RepID=A0A1Y2LTB7_EPING|nr:hypothetical protein B5807_08680 [Epicoccum nigrum]
MVAHTRACARFAAGSATSEAVDEQEARIFDTLGPLIRSYDEAQSGRFEESDESAEGPLGGGEEEEGEEGTRKPNKKVQKKISSRRKSEVELLGPAPKVPSSRRTSNARGAAKDLKRIEDIVEWNWPV